MKTLFTVIIVILSRITFAQGINIQTDTVQWEYSTIKNTKNDETINLSGHITTYGQSGLAWIQDGADYVYSIEITNSTGSWSDPDVSGQIDYDVTCNGLNGTIRISRDGSGLKIQMDFGTPESLSPHVVLPINNYEKI